MEALFAAYLTMFNKPILEDQLAGESYFHVPTAAQSTQNTCRTATGKRYPVGGTFNIGGITFECLEMASWVNGKFAGNSTRWHLRCKDD